MALFAGRTSPQTAKHENPSFSSDFQSTFSKNFIFIRSSSHSSQKQPENFIFMNQIIETFIFNKITEAETKRQEHIT
jgi:hypothetical protein